MSLTREELRINLAHAKTRKRNVGIPIWSNRHKLLQEKASFPFEGGIVELLICRPECYTDVMFISWIQQYVTSGMLRRVIDNPELASLSDKDWNRRPVLLFANWKVTPPNWQPVTKPGYVSVLDKSRTWSQSESTSDSSSSKTGELRETESSDCEAD